jgi:ankyrin repeat protein
VVELLIKKYHADVDAEDPIFGRTILSWAAGNGHAGVVKLLLERRGLNIWSRDLAYNRSALEWAAVNGHQMVELLH